MLEPPPDIEAVWRKPGQRWTLQERDRVKTWLNSEPQLTQMRAFALRHLGPNATWEDAEDCWADYNVPGPAEAADDDPEEEEETSLGGAVQCGPTSGPKIQPQAQKAPVDQAPADQAQDERSPLDKVIDSYHPAKGKFASYLCLCFKQSCWRWAKRRANSPLGGRRAEPPQNEEGEEWEFVVVDDRTPAVEADEKEREGEARSRAAELMDCIQRLPRDYRTVVILHHLQGYSIEEIARELGISMETDKELKRARSLVKVRLFRARQQLKKCLEKKGLKP